MNKRTIRRMAKVVEAGPEMVDGRACCRECSEPYSIDCGLEPTSLCHMCAQDYVATFAEALRRVTRRRRRELKARRAR